MADEHLLVVEDEKKIADVLSDYLTQAGFTVSLIDNGEQAVVKIKASAPALVLLDIMLPGLDGISVCREVRKFSDVPIIMLTARIEEVDRLLGLEIGADDYICKPFSPREVVARVKAVLRRARPGEKPQRLVAGPIILDEGIHQVTVDGATLDLTPSEFGLFHVLMTFPNRVFSRSELLDKVQGYRYDGYDRTIDSHIKNLRKKIAQRLPDREVIQTIYGVGYRFTI